MFWRCKDEQRAAANLRQALYMLRRDLSEIGDEVVRADGNVVALREGLIGVAPVEPGAGEFLEGLDLKNAEGFEEFLREKRAEAPLAEGAATVATPPVRPADRVAPALGLLPARQGRLGLDDQVRLDAIDDAIARFIAQTTTLAVHDLRGQGSEPVALPLESGTGPTHLLQALGEMRRGHLVVSFRLQEAGTHRMLWISDPIVAQEMDTEDFAALVAESVLARLAQTTVGADAPDLFPLTALTALFSLDEDLIRRTDLTVARMIEDGGPPALECLHLFAQIFKENEGVTGVRPISGDRLRDLVATVPGSDPMRPLWQSLAGYAAHMLLGENDLARMLLENAYRRAPGHSLNLDHLAIVRLMRGDLAGAERAFAHCQRVGANSPWKYTYDVTGAMIAMARGDYRRALRFANQALLRKPRFIGALRYAMAGCVLAGNEGDARLMYRRIRRLRPDYDLAEWSENMLRRTPHRLGSMMVESFRSNGFV